MFQTGRGDELFARANTAPAPVSKWSCHTLCDKQYTCWWVLALEVCKLLQRKFLTYLSCMAKCTFCCLTPFF